MGVPIREDAEGEDCQQRNQQIWGYHINIPIRRSNFHAKFHYKTINPSVPSFSLAKRGRVDEEVCPVDVHHE